MTRLRRFWPAAALLAFALLLPIAARADQAPLPSSAAPTIRLRADHVEFYYNRFLVEADGNVRVTIGDTTVMTGQTFSMDLKLNRFLLAGAVTVTSPNGSQSGAAVSDFLDYGRVYFIPIITEPDRWTFLGGDYAHPAKGRQMPGDTFAFPNLGREQPYLDAGGAAIVPHQFINFRGATLTTLGHKTIPLGAYYINFSNNRYLAENSLSGATYDATWQFAGSQNTISAIHFRYDPTNKTYAALEEHWANANGYAVASVNPATEGSKFYNLFTGYTLSKTVQVTTFTQYHLQQAGLSEPLGGQDVWYANVVKALPESSVQVSFEQFNLCNVSVYDNTNASDPTPTYCGVGLYRITNYTHPQQIGLGISSQEHKLGKTPLKFTYYYGMNYVHDSYPLQNFGNTNYDTIWSHYLGAQLTLPFVRIGSRDASKSVYLNASFSKKREWYSVPHHVDTADSRASLSRAFGTRVGAFVTYEVYNVGDYYNDGQQLAYAPYTPVINGTPYPSFDSFVGVSTFRTLSLNINYVPSNAFGFYFLARKHTDFPLAVPGLFPPPAPNYPFNNVLYSNTLGEPPYDVTGDARIRLTPTLAIDISRSYFFNFGTQRWSPSFGLQVSQ